MLSDRELRFWEKVRKGGPDECWLWAGATRGSRQKRGCFWNGSKNVDAARWVWQQDSGQSLETGEVVMHSCDNSLCVNPRHLTAGTQKENVADMWRKGRANVEAVRKGAATGRAALKANPALRPRGARHGLFGKGHRGERNGQSVLNADHVRTIRQLAGTLPQRAIAERFGVTQGIVWRIVHRKAWTHVE